MKEKKYYVYKTTNKVNNKIYIGVHGSDDIDYDVYMGSGVRIKSALEKYGIDNFEREILCEFSTVEEAYYMESLIVTEDFIKRDDVYNLRQGGGGYPTNPEEWKETSSEIRKAWWADENNKRMMIEKFNTPSRKEKVSVGIKTWIQNHPEEHAIKMNSINKNPTKIEKTANKHRGMKRTEETKKNVSESLKGLLVGKKNGNFKGYYITPYGAFESLEAASIGTGFSKICIRDRCCEKNNNTVLKYSIVTDKTKTLTEDMIGKTWFELGWDFEDEVE